MSASLLIYIWSSEDTAASEAACGLLVTVRFYLVYWWFNASYINVCFRWIVRKMLLLNTNHELSLLRLPLQTFRYLVNKVDISKHPLKTFILSSAQFSVAVMDFKVKLVST